MRHGKTDWNELHKLQGHTDISLNANGIAMAENAANEYKNDRDEKVPVIIDDRLIEMGFGEYEGIQGYTDDAGYNVNTLFHNPAGYIPDKGAESLDELFARTGEFLDTIIKPELGNREL